MAENNIKYETQIIKRNNGNLNQMPQNFFNINNSINSLLTPQNEIYMKSEISPLDLPKKLSYLIDKYFYNHLLLLMLNYDNNQYLNQTSKIKTENKNNLHFFKVKTSVFLNFNFAIDFMDIENI